MRLRFLPDQRIVRLQDEDGQWREFPVIAGGAGGDIVFNIAKGIFRHYCTLPAANDALILIPLETSGLETDAVLRDKDTFADVVSGATNEQTTMGRKSIAASVTITVDDTNDWVDIDVPDQVWLGASGNAVGALVFAYDADTTAGTDAAIIPISKHSWDAVPDGSDLTATIAGFSRAQ